MFSMPEKITKIHPAPLETSALDYTNEEDGLRLRTTSLYPEKTRGSCVSSASAYQNLSNRKDLQAFHFLRDENIVDFETQNEKISAMRECMNPMLKSMSLLGLFYERLGLDRLQNLYTGKEKKKKLTAKSRYSDVLLVFMYLNLLRLFTGYETTDTQVIGVLVLKTVSVTFTMMCTLMYSSYFYASREGALVRTLEDIADEMSDYYFKHIQKRVKIFTFMSWAVTISNAIFMAYTITLTRINETFVAPFVSHIKNSPTSAVLSVRIIVSLMGCILNFSWIFSTSMTLLISTIYFDMCRAMNARIKAIIFDTERLGELLDDYRRRHQRICRSIDRADKFLCLYMGSVMVCNIGMFVMILYILIFYPFTDPVGTFTAVAYIFVTSGNLALISFGAVRVNNQAHKLNDKVHDIDLSALSTETIAQVNTFLKRLAGDPIGFTVLRIFVIDRNTILTIIGMLITYFLLIVQLSPPPGSSDTNSIATTVMP